MVNSRITESAGKIAGKIIYNDGTLHPAAQGALTKVLNVQRPIVLAYVRSVRRRHMDATPDEMAAVLATHYKNWVTGGGAAVGATAVVPGIGTGVALGVAAAETAGFLEATALYAQSIAELHGLPVKDPARANALIMGLMLGNDGRDMVRRFAAQARGEKVERPDVAWGTLVARQIPSQMVDMLVKRLRKALVKRFAGKAAGSVLGRILPFGVGAVVGAAVNRKMASDVVKNAETAFGPVPAVFEPELEPKVSSEKKDADLMGGLQNLMKVLKRRKGKKSRGAYDIVEGEVVGEGSGAAGDGGAGSGHGDACVDSTAESGVGSGSGSGEGGAGAGSAHEGGGAAGDDTPRTYFKPDVRL